MRFDPDQLKTALSHCRDQIRSGQELSQANEPSFTVHLFETVDSTNRVLWNLLDQGATEGTVAIALQQQSGRGQWGRQWQSSPGGLYLSLALTPNLPVENSAQLTLCSAWGIAAALRNYGIPVGLKWLNDLVVQKRKLGGILTETRMQQGQITQAIVGVGINWQNPVPPTGINLQEILKQPDPAISSLEMLAAIALQGMMAGYQLWQQHGIEAILPRYQALLTSIGHLVTIDQPGAEQTAQVTGVSATGDLQVCLNQENPATSTEISLKPGTISLGYGNLGNSASV
ncbi:biotin--[acetyl-CoA-carboxylase] ligase [Leptolyngbya sp. FACHB-671]|uniref:biotin--[acetyl-CoA-carboxylase] ligase n=1 Tax=Leptolyngbya sp. FACHB-671 TaxID=2692812 RepID=UPI001684F27D|nr:biotin--[acetyl-CoA-carboxylase] ligase [Leptolyngbya sp. FACHB-671]MBD2066646.1 biotin--[acetyl-CoA-carboxylase] ligase [Leptolyngbya sp. FACHB-671]